MGAVDGCRDTGEAGRTGPRVQQAPAAGRFTPYPGRMLRAEWQAVAVGPFRELRRRGASGISLALLATVAVVVVHQLIRTPDGAVLVRLVADVRADLPLPLVLLRTPGSLVLADPGLPVWAGLPKLFLAFALAELVLGRTRTLVIACVTSLAGTLGARAMIALGHGPLGLPPETAHVLDTGPSAAVAGLFAYLAVVRRAPVLAVPTSGLIVVQSLLKPNLAGREHLIAVGLALVLGLCAGRATRGGDAGPAPRRGPRIRTEQGPAAYPPRHDGPEQPGPDAFGEDRDEEDRPDDVDVPGRVQRGAGP
ncbi:hypothetical protein [Streptomyces sp. NBC_01500]|uniref:hypothetical protein n=1 Tax=Streptomyces sp. NBC_01500 TaxID=2903886 RepID=UPI00225C2FCC|nr:hypothetical protein [Streptomyces sp. NBC_01500]MCX4548107.1 hypothetical protein [Streptomyces sp. NBC_01500]